MTINMQIGDQMTWLYVPRGGYGYTIPVNAEVVKINAKTIRIRVERRDGTMTERSVKPESLKPRGAAALEKQKRARPLPMNDTDFHQFGEE